MLQTENVPTGLAKYIPIVGWLLLVLASLADIGVWVGDGYLNWRVRLDLFSETGPV
jgi:hypothetical protein